MGKGKLNLDDFQWKPGVSQERQSTLRQTVIFPILVGVSFYFSAKFGLALSFKPDYIAVFWPPNSIILTALLLTTPRQWWIYFLAILPVYFMASYEAGFSVQRSVIFFIANCTEVLIPVVVLRRILPTSLQFKKIREVGVFIAIVVFLSPAISAFLASIATYQESLPYWLAWRVWFLGDSLGLLVLTPALLTGIISMKYGFQNPSMKRYLEAGGLTVILIAISQYAFGGEVGSSGNIPALVYLPLPLLLWASIRFGPQGNGLATFAVTLIAIWNAVNGYGPFNTVNSSENVLSLQLFLMVILISMMFLTAFIQEHKLTASALGESEDYLSTIVNSTTSVIYMKDLQGRYLLINKRWEDLFAVSNQEVQGKTDLDLFPKEIAEKFMKIDKSVMESEKTFEGEEIAPNEDGLHTYLSVKVPLFDSNNVVYGLCGISTDITDRKKMEKELERHQSHLEVMVEERTQELKISQKQLLHSEKLASLGKLTGAISHEFNNPLQGVKNVIEILKNSVSSAKEVKFANLGEKECDRMANMIRGLQDFYKPTSNKVYSIDINKCIEEVLFLQNISLQERGIQVNKHFFDNLPKVEVVEDQIKQVLLNLIQNSADSIEGEGQIILTTQKQDSHVVIKIQDTGQGISEDDQKNIFEPFFSTKDGKGTGLGLSISYGIIQDHGGEIKVKSKLNKGATFTIILPLKG